MKKMKLFYLLTLLCLPFIGITQSVTTYNRSTWTVTPSSEELTGDLPNGPATKLLDGNNSSFWVSNYSTNFEEYNHTLVFDMQVAQPVNQLYYVPRENSGTTAYSGSVSFGDNDGVGGISFGAEQPVIFSNAFNQHIIDLPAIQNHRYFRVTITQNYDDHNAGTNTEYITTLAEVGAIYNSTLDAGLTSFTVQAQPGGVKLDWSTAFEVNSTSYNITRSNDAVNFTTIGTLAATGTATTAATYTFTDAAPLTGFNFYRLELANSTGPATKSAIKNAEFPLITYSSNQPKNLNVFYFIPAGKAPWPDFKNRLDTLLINLQTYYKDEMQRNGRGSRTFGMVTDATHKKVKIIVVHGKYPISNYLSIGGGGTEAIQAEIDAYMAANPSPYYSSHSLMIAPVVGYDVATATIDEGVPVGGTGKNCHVIDNPELKWSWLGRDNSPESFNATYQIGAWAHEFGHAVGLPHNFLKVSEEPALGTSLMSNGNSTFGRSTTSLTSTDAAILNHNQLFNDGSISYYGPNKASISSIHACYSASKNAIIVAGRVSTIGAQVTDVEIYNDPSNGSAPGVGDNNDYDAVAWTTPIIGTDSFYVEMPITELQVRDSSLYQMRFRLVQLDGNLSDFRYQYDFHSNLPYLTDPAFTPISATITATAGANGSISSPGATVINCAGNQTYTITANAGYAIATVLVDGVNNPAAVSSGTYTFTTVAVNHTISATFVAANYTITASAGANGSISPTGAVSVVSGASQAFTITANPCYAIATVLVDGVNNPVAVSSGTYTFSNVTAAHTIAVTFTQLSYNITASAGTNGSISPNGITSVNCGANQAYTITPDAGYNVQSVLVDGAPQGAITTYTFTNVTATHTITADFIAIGAGCAVTGSATTTAVSCFGGNNGTATITLTGAGSGAPGTYTVDGGSPVAYTTNPFTITGLTAGNHTIVATVTAGGCVSADISINVGSPAATFAATFVKTNLSSCSGTPNGTITVTPAGGTALYTYSWTGTTGSGNPATTPFTAGNVSSLTGLNYGYYNVTITDAGGCGVVTLTNIHVEFAYSVYVTASGSNSSSCGNTGSISLYGNAGVQPYTYSIDGTTYQPTNTFTGLPAATYTGYVKDAAGCVSTKTGIVVGASAAVTVTAFTRAASVCANDGSIEVYRTGGIPPYTYSKDGISYQASNTFTALAAGSYTVYVKDGAGCVGTQSATVAQGAALAVTANKTNTSTCMNDGTIQVIVTGGTAPYTYSKDGGTTFQAGNTFSGLTNTTYAVVVKDSKGCTGNLNVTINLNTIVVTASVVNAPNCAGTGSIQLFRTGGVGPYMYSLDGNTYQASTIFTNKAPGTYTAYVKDSKTCVGSLAGIVVGPTNCVPTFTKNEVNNTRAAVVPNKVIVKAYPNPTASTFTLQLEGYNSNEKVAITVTDVLGRKVIQSQQNAAKQITLGGELKAGIYFIEVLQGENKQVVKLVKE